jgi:hypothetical protein
MTYLVEPGAGVPVDDSNTNGRGGFGRAAASPSGLEYESYFNLDGCVLQVHVGGCNPAATAEYQELF